MTSLIESASTVIKRQKINTRLNIAKTLGTKRMEWIA